MKDDVNDIKVIMTKHLAGETTPDEDRLLFNWVSLSNDNAHEFEKMKKLFSHATTHYTTSHAAKINVEQEWQHFLTKVGDTPVRQMHPVGTHNIFLKIAAAILLLLATTAILYYYSLKTAGITINTTANIEKLSLPDGSTVIINRNSQIVYDDNFGEANRNISLSGEAFFEVKRNETLPFIIAARETRIEVLGTSFNVLAYDSLSDVQVTVKTGKVKFAIPRLKKAVELHAGEKGTFAVNAEVLSGNENDDINYQAWNTHQLAFTETPLAKVVDDINKAYHTNIIISGPVSENCLLTASFNNQSLDAVLNVLQSTLNITYTRVGNRIEIISGGC